MAYVSTAPPPKALTSHRIPALFPSQLSCHLLLNIISTVSRLVLTPSLDLSAWFHFLCHSAKAYPFSHPLPKSHNILNIHLLNSPALKAPIYWPKLIICHLIAWGAGIPWTKPPTSLRVSLARSLSPSLQSSLYLILAFPSPPPKPFTAQKFLNENFLSLSQAQSPVHSASILTPCPPLSEVR